MGVFEQGQNLDGSVTHLFISEQILLENRYCRHDWCEIVSPAQIEDSVLPLLDGTSDSRETGLGRSNIVLLNACLESQISTQRRERQLWSAYQDA